MSASYSSLNLVLLGPPGSGKTTQGSRLAASYRVPLISTGTMLEAEVERASPVGLQVRRHIERGELVPDRLLAGIVLGRLDREDCARGFILDGYPRTADQAALLDGILAELGRGIERAVLIDVPREVSAARLSGHRQPSAVEAAAGDVAIDGRRWHEVVDERIRAWEVHAPVLMSHYRARGLLLAIDGDRPVDEVAEALARAVGAPVGA